MKAADAQLHMVVDLTYDYVKLMAITEADLEYYCKNREKDVI